MKLIVTPKSETPIYEQLYRQIVAQILSGDVAADQCLPSIRFVARELNVSVIPVKAAYEKLEQDGYIYTIPSKGCFVRALNENKRTELAKEKIAKCVQYCRQLNLTDEEILQIITESFLPKA